MEKAISEWVYCPVCKSEACNRIKCATILQSEK